MPGSSDTEAEVFDMLGNISSITVHCIMTAADVATLKTSVDSITALCSNEQSTTVDFVSDITGTAKVMVNNVDVTVEVNGLQCVADLNIQLLVGVRN
ncbi:MAG TPA: hypothetical protein ENN45_04325 [Bacteroidetes bacterium]|nr:hypothetical protein [Bacteroidota bacterium]